VSEPFVQTGRLPAGGAMELLRRIEDLRTTGVLRFHSGGQRGEVRLVRGQIAVDQSPMDGTDPLDVLLNGGEADYELIQRLPPLPVSQGDDQSRRGSLAVHVAADLMNYCEQAGLTGLLRLTNAGRAAQMVYDRGELVGIRVDGSDDADLQKVFGWEEGTFEIEARPLAPTLEAELALDEPEEDPADRDPTIPRIAPRGEPTGVHFLNVVEVALSHVMQERESYRPPTRTGPALPPLADARPRPLAAEGASTSASRPEREPTVKIVYHSPSPRPADVPRAMPVPVGAPQDGAMSEDNQAPEHDAASVSEEAPLVHTPPEAPEKGGGGEERPSMLVTAAWIAVVVLLGVFTIRLLALMSSVE
jgi:hypothetical protein